MLDLGTVQTNIVVFALAADAPDAASVVAAARARGVRVNALGARTIRALTHRDVSRAQCLAAAEILLQSVEANAG
jgi:threonine aldolase